MAASFMAIPGGLLYAKILVPSTEPSGVTTTRVEFGAGGGGRPARHHCEQLGPGEQGEERPQGDRDLALAGYAALGVPMEYLLAASFMAIPGGLLYAKILVPSTASLRTARPG
jgi:nucleoside permease NupC